MKILFHFSCAFFIAALFAVQAHATCEVGDFVNSVTDDPTLSPGTFEYRVLNGCDGNNQQLLNDFYLPYFDDAGISNISVPTGWSYSIQPTNDVFGLANAGAIEFVATPRWDITDPLTSATRRITRAASKVPT